MKRLIWILPILIIILAVITSLFFIKTSKPQPLLGKNLFQGQQFFEDSDWRHAAEQFEKELVLMPETAEAHLQLGILYGDYLGKKSEALRHYESYLQLASKNEKALLVREWLKELKENSKGISSLDLEEPKVLQETRSPPSPKEEELKAELRQQSLVNLSLRNTLREKEIELGQIRSQSVEVSTLKKSQSELIQALKQAQVKLVDSQAKVNQLEGMRQSLEEDLEESKDEKLKLEQALGNLKAEASHQRDLGTKNSVIMVENRKLKEDNEALQEKEVSLNQQIQTLLTTRETLQKQINELQETLLNHYAHPSQSSPNTRKYRVKKGESLRTIAAIYYGDDDKWRLIYKANRSHIMDPDILTPGQILDIPAEKNKQ
ncbi:MAG: LysM peptidoglycan-binding domain-containing protein [Chlamydiae bacterium]|nr:LysM peptidoglycan-binding domain-containing protein [Chlamydiota bacterium]MBI3276498.1 LysM peptidoglycan-binding domain-containing protein [Chlamydiota bacterium]